MAKFIIGFILGAIISGGVTYAASRYITLQSANGLAISASNPLQIQAY